MNADKAWTLVALVLFMGIAVLAHLPASFVVVGGVLILLTPGTRLPRGRSRPGPLPPEQW